MKGSARIQMDEKSNSLILQGEWSVKGISNLDADISALCQMSSSKLSVDASRIDTLDTAGALMLHELLMQLKEKGYGFNFKGLSAKRKSLYELISKQAEITHLVDESPEKKTFAYRVGKSFVNRFLNICDFIGFLGESFVVFLRTLPHPRRWQWRSIMGEIQLSGYEALPIVAMMAFLIGIVVAYQLSAQLLNYGANIFIVDFTGIAILREFAPLITAILIAGRTSTSFAALLGSMKVNEEVDALKTMGVSPMERLVMPKIYGLLIALPLLVVWADIWGVFGSMVMARDILDVKYAVFLDRFQEKIALKHYVYGLVKTPVFALIIAGVGCFQGFKTEGSSEDVGRRTTVAAVQAIFLIIVADAAFSVVFRELGLF